MAMKKREKILVGATGALLAVFGVFHVFSGGGGSGDDSTLAELRLNRDSLRKDLDDKKNRAARLKKIAERLGDSQERSLPSDRKAARSLYQAWLREIVDSAALDDVKIESTDPKMGGRGAYWALGFTVRASGTVKQLTRLLHRFYAANHLHEIRTLGITPLKDGRLNLVVSIEALSLPGVDRKRLATGMSDLLQQESLDVYLDQIVRRKMEDGIEGQDGEESDEPRFASSGGLFATFVPYVPPPQPKPERVRTPERVVAKPPKPPGFDNLKYTFLTSIVEVDGVRTAWLTVRTTGKSYYLKEGEAFEIGSVKGAIGAIGMTSIEIDIDGQRRLVAFRQSVSDGIEISNTP